MSVHKLILQVTVMTAAETAAEVVEAYSNMSLEDVAGAITFGEDIGSGVKVVSSETLTDPEQIKNELLAIGNDGAFFDVELGQLSDH